MSAPPRADALAVLDIDGVVADVSHRLHLLDSHPANWRAFFDAAAHDPPLPEGIRLAHRLALEHPVVWLTGRPERIRDLTVRWLRAHDLPTDRLLMRARGDFRSAQITKLDALRALVSQAPVALVVDDDPAVVEAVRQAGLPVQLADWLPYRPALGRAQEEEGRT